MAEGDYERAALHYEEALLLARQHNIAEAELVFRSNLGGARVGLGHCEQAETELREVITLVGDSGFGDLSETYRFLAEALLGQGRVEEALAAAQRALALGAAVGAPEFIAIAWRVLGQVAAWLPAPVRIPEPESGVMREYTPSQCFEESMRISEATGMKGEIPRTLRSWALFELQKGRYEVGVQMVQQAIEGFLSVGAPHEVERTRLLERLDDL